MVLGALLIADASVTLNLNAFGQQIAADIESVCSVSLNVGKCTRYEDTDLTYPIHTCALQASTGHT